MHVRVCPECEEEYRPDIAVCADCGTDLVDRELGEKGEVLAPEPAAAEPGVPMHPIFSGPAFGLKPLADRLAAAGVPFALVPDTRAQLTRGEARLFLGVPVADGERAMAALEEFHGRGTELGLTELAVTWGTDAEDDAPMLCPACEAPVPAEATACPECGLELGDEEPPATEGVEEP